MLKHHKFHKLKIKNKYKSLKYREYDHIANIHSTINKLLNVLEQIIVP